MAPRIMRSSAARSPATACRGVDNTWVGTWIAGALGIAATFLLCAGLVFLVRRRRLT